MTNYSIEKLIDKLLKNYPNSEWNKFLTEEDISRMNKNYNHQEFQIIRDKLRGLRDQYYAHLDKKPKKTIYDYTPNYMEVEALLNLHENILNEISLKCFHVEIKFKNPSFGSADGILHNLAEYQKKVISDIWKHK